MPSFVPHDSAHYPCGHPRNPTNTRVIIRSGVIRTCCGRCQSKRLRHRPSRAVYNKKYRARLEKYSPGITAARISQYYARRPDIARKAYLTYYYKNRLARLIYRQLTRLMKRDGLYTPPQREPGIEPNHHALLAMRRRVEENRQWRINLATAALALQSVRSASHEASRSPRNSSRKESSTGSCRSLEQMSSPADLSRLS